jgi:hypothetical protein
MGSPSHYPSGINNRQNGKHPMGLLPIFDPTKFHIFHDDFNAFVTAASGVTGWHKDEVNAGTDPVVQDAAGGVILFTIDNADNDNQHYAWGTNTTVHEIFKLTPGKRAWLRTRFKTEDADKDIPMLGLQVSQDDPWGTEPSDQFLFRSTRATPAAIEFAAGKTNSTEVTVALGDLADDTWVTLTAYYDGKNSVFVYRESDAGVVTNSGVATVTSSTSGDLLPDTEMGVAFGMEATDTGADDMSIDFITVIIER